MPRPQSLFGPTNPPKSALSKGFSNFRDDQNGSIIALSLFFFVIMIVTAGIAVDMAHHEANRIKLQNTTDRAVLAATSLDQTLPAADVVRDYFNKSGLDPDTNIIALQVEERLNYRSVNARTAVVVDTWFAKSPPPPEHDNGIVELQDWYRYMGNASWAANAIGGAEQGYTDIEISLIVDVSGSMNSSNRIQNLKVAAKEFVDTVLVNDPNADNVITLSMVPYSAAVNIGPSLANIYDLSDEHNFSTCAIFDAVDFRSVAIDYTQELQRLSHFERGRSSGLIDNPWCPTTQFRRNAILPYATDPVVVKAAIDDLTAYGNTAIDLGMKWGVALLDPGTRPVVDQLIANSAISEDADGRPYDYGQSNNLKVIVLMTDGANTTEYDLREPYKSGMSPIWVERQYAGQSLWQLMQDTNGDMSLLSYRYDDGGTPDDHTDDRFMRYDQASTTDRELTHPYGYDAYDDTPPSGYDYAADGAYTTENNGLVERLSWAEIFATWDESNVYNAVGREPYDRSYITWTEYRAPRNQLQAIVDGAAADNRLDDICDAAKNEGNIVYTIAFEAPDAGQAALSSCATSDATYFDVAGTDISAAFESIATDITKLRLTQ